ncbi:MAG: lipopolysaccharide heptosyltransferase II [Candidatus Omnitrophica bacterium]|nr:lipopolysaccharide heptosyltransferase II [Candidatus Omnitrophota bacterium]
MEKEKIDRILVINVNWVGDVLFSTPAIRALRKHFPDAHIACMVVPRCKEVLELNPRLNELIIYDEKGENKGLIGKLKLISELKARRFDCVFLFHRSLTRTLMVALSGIKERVGIDNPKRGFLLTKKIKPQPSDIHKVEQFLNIVKVITGEDDGKSMEFFTGEEDEVFARGFLKSHGIGEGDRFIILNPGGNWDPKRWPAGNFAGLGDRLYEEYKAPIIITGAQKDVELGEKISGMMKHKPVIAAGKTTLKQLAAIMKRASLVISNDSGPMHIAVSQGAKTIAIFGPTDPRITGPYGDGVYTVLQSGPVKPGCKIPCYDVRCEEPLCMKAVTVEDVMLEAEKLLKWKT